MKNHNIIFEKIKNIFKYVLIAIIFLVLHITILNIGIILINLFINIRENITIVSILNSIFTVVVIFVIMKLMGFKKTDIIRKENFKIDIMDLIIITMIYIIFSYIFELIKINIEDFFFREFHIEYMKDYVENFRRPQYNIWVNDNMVLVILGATVLPTMEELYFRVFIHKVLIKNSYSISSVIFISAMSFGFRHWFQSPFSVLNTIFIGIIFSIIMLVTKNILYPIFLHGIVRLIMIIYIRIFGIDYINNIIQNNTLNIIKMIICSFIMFIIFCSISYIIRKKILSEDIIFELKNLFK